MKLHLNKEDFKDLIILTARDMNILEVYIEKDYWVCYILKNLSESKYLETIVFKGGTSLSKAYDLIERFSEDIDLQLVNFEGGDSKKKNFIKKIEAQISKGLKSLENHPRESKSGNIRKTIYYYDKLVDGNDFFQGSQELVLEINSMSTPEPYEKREIRTYISEFLEKTNKEYIKEFELESFSVNVLDKKRTFVEKIFAVMDFSFESNYIEELSNKIRHIYDLYILFNDREVNEFFNSNEFFQMASKVVVENDFFGKRKNIKYSESVLYNIDELNKVKRVYGEVFSKLVFGLLPNFELIKEVIKEILEKIRIWERDFRKYT